MASLRRRPRFDIDWTAPVRSDKDNEESLSSMGGGGGRLSEEREKKEKQLPLTYFQALREDPAIFEDKDWYGVGAVMSSSSRFAPLSVLEVHGGEEERYSGGAGRSFVGAEDDYLYDFGKVVSPKTSSSSSPSNCYEAATKMEEEVRG